VPLMPLVNITKFPAINKDGRQSDYQHRNPLLPQYVESFSWKYFGYASDLGS